MAPEIRNSGGRARRPLLDNGSVIMFPQQRTRMKKQCIAYRNNSVHAATNLQSTVTEKNAIVLLLEEVISKPTSGRELTDRRQNKTEDKQKSEAVRNEVLILCGIVTVTYVVL
jgi:hypothetical protein